MRRIWLIIRVVAYAVFVCLGIVWFTAPPSPSRLFRPLLLAVLVGALLVAVLLSWVNRRRPGRLARLRFPARMADVILGNALLTFLLLEIVLRVSSAVIASPLLIPPNTRSEDRIERWRFTPGAPVQGISANTLGFMDEDFVEPRTSGVRRIVAFSDSFGVGVVHYRDNYLTLLDGFLDARDPTEVYNFSITGVGPIEYLHLYKTQAHRYSPDIVLVCLFVGNDVARTPRAHSILHGSSLYTLTVAKRVCRISPAGWREQRPVDENLPTFSEQEFNEIERARIEVCRIEPDGAVQRAWEDTFGVLAEMQRTMGARLRFALLPDEFQVNDILWRSLVGDAESKFDRELPNRRFEQFFTVRQIPFLDLLPTLRAAQKEGPTYKLRDTHWNRRGNLAAARALAEWLN